MDFQQLLYEEESTTLDFKQESYPFSKASDFQKSELLKDILAFSNAWRRTTAYILLGVAEVKGSKSKIVGITDELDDAQLQEFINKKTQRPITFSYRTLIIEGVKLGVIEIPEQKRPIYLLKDYGKLKKSIVYIRRGSSTDEAPPDEVMEMAHAKIDSGVELPELKLELADVVNECVIGNEITLKSVVLNLDRFSEIRDFSDQQPRSALVGMYQTNTSFDPFSKVANVDYYRELATYEVMHSVAQQLSFAITNPSKVSVTDITVTITFAKKGRKFLISNINELPKKPESHSNSFLHTPLAHTIDKAVFQKKDNTFKLEELGDCYRISLTYRKIQPKKTLYCDEVICIRSFNDILLDGKVVIYADNLPEPIQSSLSLNYIVEHRTKLFEGLT